MSLVNAKCTNCGGILEVDNTKDAMMCKFCGSAFIVEKAIQNYNITNVTNNHIETQIVHVHAPEKSDFEIEKGVLKSYSGSDKIIIVPENVGEIGESAFEDCKYIEEIILPQNLKRIAPKAFYNCNFLRKINLPDNLEKIEEQTFYNCNNLSDITIPDSVKDIGKFAFYNCHELNITKLPPNLTAIKTGAFKGCGIKNIVIHDKIKSIDNLAFNECEKLEKCDMGNGVYSIGASAFLKCYNLKEVILGKAAYIYDCAFQNTGIEKISGLENVRYIGKFAFAYARLKDLVLQPKTHQVNEYAFMWSKIENLTLKDMETVVSLFEDTQLVVKKSKLNRNIIDKNVFYRTNIKQVNLINTKLNHCIVCDGELFLGKCKNCKTKYKKSK